jgi:Tfp pilus assembly protein PilF
MKIGVFCLSEKEIPMNNRFAPALIGLIVLSSAACGDIGKRTASPQATATPKVEGDYLSNFNEGWALTQQGRHAEAEPLYRKALAVNPNALNALNNLGWSLAQQGKYAEAIPLFEKAIAMDPNYELARNNLAWTQGQLNPPAKAKTR